jgi:hypothetical protein
VSRARCPFLTGRCQEALESSRYDVGFERLHFLLCFKFDSLRPFLQCRVDCSLRKTGRLLAISKMTSAAEWMPLGIDGQPQANIIPSAHRKPQKSRHRASVACAQCRDRRTRCVVPAGENECNQCRTAGYDCVINYADERRK